MGIGFSISSSSYDGRPTSNGRGNPNPSNYKLINYVEQGGNLLLMISYPDCSNYEGKKILLYKNTKLLELINQKTIDPHFSNNKSFKSPFARFEPTDAGWNAGLSFLKTL